MFFTLKEEEKKLIYVFSHGIVKVSSEYIS